VIVYRVRDESRRSQPSLAAKVLENYREGKAAKRREGWKRTITVAGVGDGFVAGGVSEGSSEVGKDPEMEEEDDRRCWGSDGNWM
jgi:hypothetical protein